MATVFRWNTSSAPKRDASQFIPWTEKYRPKSVDEVAFQDDVTKTLKKSIESRNLPHLLFYGPPGTGKTSTILAIAREIYGPELFKQRILELNASDERGIDVVRTKIKDFSRTAISSAGGKAVPYKLVILDEADSMTPDAQTALRRTMETYSQTTRFCLICNYVSRIIEPLASRCAKFRFKSLPLESMSKKISEICQQEKCPFNEKIGQKLNEISGGDLRRAINVLQSAFSLHGQKLDETHIADIAGVVPGEIIEDLLKVAHSSSFDQLTKTVSNAVADGYPVAQIFHQLFDKIVSSPEYSSIQKAEITEKLAEADKCLQDGADEYLQLMSVLSFVMKVCKK